MKEPSPRRRNVDPTAHRARLVPLLLAGVLLLAIPAELWARAGGGHGYSGGGGGGGGGGHWGGGGGGGGDGGGALVYLIFQLIRLCVLHPVIGIPLLIVIGLLIYYGGQQGTDVYQTSIIRRGGEAIDSARKNAAIEAIRTHDPQFDQTAFCQRVAYGFNKIQAAWTAQDLAPVRPFISDGVYERFSLQFAEQRELGFRNVLDQLIIEDIRIVDLTSAGVFDEVAVRIAARGADYDTSLKDNRVVRGTPGVVEPFVEVWSFLRKRGALSQPNRPGLLEGNCPNCGAPVAMNQSANCAHCKALLRSGQYDWVLSEITQESEWHGSETALPPGVDALRENDPGFDRLALEDRASVIFWRRAAADRLGKIDPLRKMASEEFCHRYLSTLRATDATGKRSFVGQCAVGSVQMLGFLSASQAGQFERALIEIRWSGTRQSVASGGPAQNLGSLMARTLFVLGRMANAKSDADKGIFSAHCPNCGAPEAGGASNACDYCQTVLNDGSHGWILLDLMPIAGPAAQALIVQLGTPTASLPTDRGVVTTVSRSPHSDAGLMAWAVKMAAIDGQIDPAERRLLASAAAARNLSPERLDQMIDAAIHRQLDAPEPSDRTEAEQWLTAMAQTAQADGRITPEENALLMALGQKVGLSDYDLQLMLKQARARQYSAAVSALRARTTNQN